MKFILTIFLTVITNAVCLSQDQYKMPNVDGLSFPLFFDKSLRNNFANKLDTLGIDGSCWLKFKISSTGSIKQLEISPGTDSSLSGVLKQIILYSDGLWSFRNENEWFIILFKYTLQKKGKTNSIVLDSNELNNLFIKEGDSQLTYTFYPYRSSSARLIEEQEQSFKS